MVVVLFTTQAFPAFGANKKVIGNNIKTRSFEITRIASKRLENTRSGLIYYSFKAHVRNRTKRTLKASFYFQGLDRDGYEIEDVHFYDRVIKANSTVRLSDKLVIDRRDYDKLWKWEAYRVRIE